MDFLEKQYLCVTMNPNEKGTDGFLYEGDIQKLMI